MNTLWLDMPEKETLIGVPTDGLSHFIAERLGRKWEALKVNLAKLKLKSGDTEDLAEELLRYLFLVSENTFEDTLYPSHLIETAWQCLLLDPVLYHQIGDLLLSLHGYTDALVPVRILPYTPASQISLKDQTERYMNTLRAYVATFGTIPPVGIWPPTEKCSKTDTGFMSPMCISHIASHNVVTIPEPPQRERASSVSDLEQPDVCAAPGGVCNMENGTPLNSVVQVSVRAPFMDPILISVDQTVATVGYLKYEIERLIKMRAAHQVMYCKGRLLRDATILSTCVLAERCCIHVFYSLDNVQNYVAKNYFTKVVKLRAARITSENIHPTVSRISGNIVLRKKDRDPLLTESHLTRGLEEATTSRTEHYRPLVMRNGL